jgi:hypothetical protein
LFLLGSWIRAVSADNSGIISSFALCATKLLDQQILISSTQLEPVLNLLNNSNQTSLLLDCDKENRAHSMEWLAYTRLQTGDWSGTIALLRDFFIANNRSTITPDHYFQFAYRTQARTIIELFFWFPYNYQFVNRTQQVLALNVTQIFIPIGINSTRWYPIWSEAGLRFSNEEMIVFVNYIYSSSLGECLRLVTADNMSNNTSIVDDHLNQLAILSNRASSINPYVSISISMMISQIGGIRYYVNQSWQECLNELDNATQLEGMLVAGANTPTLIFARSSELLAMHLLLIYTKFQEQSVRFLLFSIYNIGK